jgi:putative transposase
MTYKYKLKPTAEQERELGRVLSLCRYLHNTALEQRITAWQRLRISVSRCQQEAELKDIRAEFPAYEAIHSHVLQDVQARLDKTYQAFFRRVRGGEKAGFPRYQGRDHYHSFTYKEFGNGATLDNGFLALSKIRRIAVRCSRQIAGTPKTVTVSQGADGWYVCFSCADVPVQPLPTTGQEAGIDLGIKAFATLSDGAHLLARLVQESRACAENRAAAGVTPQEGQQSSQKGCATARQSASDSALATTGLSA